MSKGHLSDGPNELGDVWTDIRPVESINIDWFTKNNYSPAEVEMFLQGYTGIIPEKDDLKCYQIGEKIKGTPIYVEWSHPMTVFVDKDGFMHTSEGTTQTWKEKTFVFVGDKFSRGIFGIDNMWVPEGSRWAEALEEEG